MSKLHVDNTIYVGSSPWAEEKGEPYSREMETKIARVDLDTEQVEEFDDKECPSCANTFDVLRLLCKMEGVSLIVIYFCPQGHVWHKELQT